jgi:phosphoribosyl 1,2-cyclic phosphodiesterase
MNSGFEFLVRYWGTTGSFARCFRPDEMTDRLAAALEYLLAGGGLARLADERPDQAAIRRFLVERVPLPLRSTYGGNTTCVEIQTPDELIVLDCGSGVHPMGAALSRRWNAPDYAGSRRAHVLFTHAHMDHIAGAPFMDPFYDPRNHFVFLGPRVVLDRVDAVLGRDGGLSQVYFPVTYANMAGIKDFRAIEAGETFQIGQTEVATHPLVHPGGSVAYRLSRGGRRIVLATDHEHPEIPDPRLAEFARGADLLYTDAQYTADEYEGRVGIGASAPKPRRGWGHSTVEAAVATAAAANVRCLHLGHHDPSRDDKALWQLEERAKALLRDTLAAAGKPPDACMVELAHEGNSYTV